VASSSPDPPTTLRRMAKPKKPLSVRDACMRKLGVHRGAFVAAHVAQWAITAEDLGRFPTTAEYAEWWALDERTGWRHRAEIRDVFGEVEPVVMAVAARIEGSRSPRAVMRLAVA
jgi:hypothetical protein